MFHVQISEVECLQARATLVFRFRHFLCPFFCLILLPLSIPLLSLPTSRRLSFLLHVSAFAATLHLPHISHAVSTPLGSSRLVAPRYLPARSLNYINRIISLGISGLLAPAARL